jgi:predicted O-linked N-acetylglucosamine transferase (SPINDLY family)
VEVFCYAEVKRPDSVTEDLRRLADHWLVTVGLSDDALAERIRADGIDILVDLAGHTANSRLLVFARKPAPIQVTWLGYPNTTGCKPLTTGWSMR